MLENTALIVVDMQKYYLSRDSDFFKYSTINDESSMDYILNRTGETVIPNIKNLLDLYRANNGNIIFLRLCSNDPSRNDLHRFFRKSFLKGKEVGYDNVYPLASDSFSEVIDEIKPLNGEKVFIKTTFSAFNSTDIDEYLRKNNIKILIFTGLATSQCVETTARDASDKGFSIIHIEDAQADYSETFHLNSLYISMPVCGGRIVNTKTFLFNNKEILNYISSEYN